MKVMVKEEVTAIEEIGEKFPYIIVSVRQVYKKGLYRFPYILIPNNTLEEFTEDDNVVVSEQKLHKGWGFAVGRHHRGRFYDQEDVVKQEVKDALQFLKNGRLVFDVTPIQLI